MWCEPGRSWPRRQRRFARSEIVALMRRRVLLIGGAGLMGVAALAYGLDRPAGYGATVDFKAVLGPPPAVGSAEAVAEKAGFAKAAMGIGSARWAQASRPSAGLAR